jgi:Fe-S-cluster containining protein
MPVQSLARCRAAVERLADERLASARDEGDLAALLRDVDAVVTVALSFAPVPRAACGPGCAACCTLQVATLPIEGAVIAGFLRLTSAPADLAQLARRLDDFQANVRWLEDRERARAGFRCPFLDARRACRIHVVRPLACRSVSSLDATDCASALAADDEEGPPLVRMNLLQKALYDDARDALGDASRRRGLDARRRDVAEMTALFLADPGLAAHHLGGAALPIE